MDYNRENEIEHYKSEIENLFNNLMFYEQKNKKLENELLNKNDEAKELYKAVKYYEDSIKQLNAVISSIKKDMKTTEVEIEKYKKENLRLTEEIKNDVDEINQIIREKEFMVERFDYVYQKVIGNIAMVEEVLNYKNFHKMIVIHSLLGLFKVSSLEKKLKLVVKILLRLLGVKKHFHNEGFRMDLRILSYLCDSKDAVKSLDLLQKNKVEKKYDDALSIQTHIKKEEILLAQEPFISVLLPVYNHSKFICDAIEGVQRQEYSNWELIILDDGSTDGLISILERYKNDLRIRLYTQDNQRLPNSLTNLHDLASGQFITWTSADNIMEPEMLKELSNELINQPQAVMVFADVSIIDDKGEYVSHGYREMNRDEERLHIMRLPHSTIPLGTECDNYINACFMYRADAAKALKGEYGADLEGLEDYDFWLRLQVFGEIRHIKNKEPLYRYRVHENTMSEDLIRNKMDEHVKRSKMLIDFNLKREDFVSKTWNINIDERADNAIEFKDNLHKLHYNFKFNSGKMVEYLNVDKIKNIKDNDVAICYNLDNECYQLYAKQNNELEVRASIFRGIDISCLARKSRYTKINGLFWEYPARFAHMQVIGCHIDLNMIDVEKTIKFLNLNKSKLFIFCSLKKADNKEVVKTISSKCTNVCFMEEKKLGEPVYMYASWDCVFIPPLKVYNKSVVMTSIILAWSIGKWIIIEDSDEMEEVLPLVSNYFHNEELLGIKKVDDLSQIEDLLDEYIDMYSPIGVIKRLLAFLNGIAQDVLLKRPNFGYMEKKRKQPLLIQYNSDSISERLKSSYLAIMVDTLDIGGLEQVVAFLVRKLSLRGIQVQVFCTLTGGKIADTLKEEGYCVIEFNNDREKFDKYLQENCPILINTHYTKKMLDIPSKYNIPIIEVIHNMYVFQDDQLWKKERSNEKYFKKMIAVSSLVKSIYVKKHGAVDLNKIVVVANAADNTRVKSVKSNYIRSLLGINYKSIVFINVSSFDGRKNQLGIITAFNTYYNTINQDTYLIMIGNPLSQFYKDAVTEYIKEMPCKENIIILNYHKDVLSLMKAADVFLMPSYYEGWSISATESLYVGTPLIHSRCGSGIELINNGKNGILINNPAGDIEEISSTKLMQIMNSRVPQNNIELIEAMTTMTESINEWRNKRYTLASNALMDYSRENMVDNYIAVFEDIVN